MANKTKTDATAVHLTNIENFLNGKGKDSDYIARTYKDNANWPRLTLHGDLLIDPAMSTKQLLESFFSCCLRQCCTKNLVSCISLPLLLNCSYYFNLNCF